MFADFFKKNRQELQTFLCKNEVTVAIKWAQYLHREADRKRKDVLWLNLDETSVPVVMLKSRGTLKRTSKKIAWRYQAKVKASYTETRMCFTLVAVICTDPPSQCVFVGSYFWVQFVCSLLGPVCASKTVSRILEV